MTSTPARTTSPQRQSPDQIKSSVGLLASALLLFLFALNCGGGGAKLGTDANSGAGGGAGLSDGGQCGAPGQPCCGANSCISGGCCLAVTTGGQTTRECVGNGQACTPAGVAGTCFIGSCNIPQGTSCGGIGNVCCGGATDAGAAAPAAFCTGAGTRCVVGTCSACGGSGQACCQGPNANQCQATLLCLAVASGGNVCNACGGAGQPCCANNTCNSGLGCSNPPGNNTPATCDTCGASGQACCLGNNCQAGLACGGRADGGAGNCSSCGASGQICCAGPSPCQGGMSCLSAPVDDRCGECGGAGQPCCGTGNVGTCSTGLACAGRANATGVPGMCATCGGTGQPCCPANGGADGGPQAACGMTLSCLVSETGNQCGTCGGSGQPCCGTGNAGTCSTGFACAGRNAGTGTPGMCTLCGGAGQVCCPTAGGAMACEASLSCNVSATGNQCGTCGSLAQACCGLGNGGTCSTGLACGGRNAGAGTPGMCATCGGAGQLCCPTGGAAVDGGPPPPACQGALACLLSATGNQCGTCGGGGQPCCGTGNNPTCVTGLACGGRNAATGVPGMCAACGASGQLCCPTNVGAVDGGPPPAACTATLACLISATGNQCGACGAAGQSCCGTGNNGTCTAAGLVCSGRMNGGGVPGTCAAPMTPVDAGPPDAPAGQ